MAKKKKQASKPVDIYPKVVETFREIGNYELNGFSTNWDKPFCWNGMVSIKKYRITIEIIEEPIEVYQERLEKLWIECDNHHHWLPLENAAKSIGYTFKGERGFFRNKKP